MDWNLYTLIYDPPDHYTINEPNIASFGSGTVADSDDGWGAAYRFSKLDDHGDPNSDPIWSHIVFQRSADKQGYSWVPRTPRTVYSDDSKLPDNPKLIVLPDGTPAVTFVEHDFDDYSHGAFMYARATDSTGSMWLPAIEIHHADTHSGRYQQIIIADGRPAMFLCLSDVGALFYIRANDALGDSWPEHWDRVAPPNHDINEGVAFWEAATTVNGRPAAAYSEFGGGSKLWYLEAQDKPGTAWNAPMLVKEFPAFDIPVQQPLLGAFGNPQHACIAYARRTTDEFVFARLN
jgi:hypothetical protein